VTKVCILSDLHLKFGSPYDREPGDRLEDQVKVGQRIVEIARKRECSLILNGGDSYEGPTVVPEEYDAWQRIFGDCEIPVYSVRGNGKHDASKRAISAPAVVERSRYFTHPDLTVVAGVAVAFLPSQAVDRLVAARPGVERAAINQEAAVHLVSIARGLKEDCERSAPGLPHILLGHWPVEGGVTATGVEAISFAEPILPLAELQAMEWALVAMGHVHAPQILGLDSASPGGPIVIPGSPLPLNFGEASSKHGVFIFDTADNSVAFVKINSRSFEEIEYDPDEWPHIEFAEAMCMDAIVKLTYTATAEQAKRIDQRKLRDALYAAGAHKVFAIEATVERETRARVEISDKLGELEALDLYMAAQAIEGPTAAAVRERIARYLEDLPGRDATGGASWKPIRLRAENFRTFETLDVTFPDGLFSIIGTVKDATAVDSNGAGKSTIILGVDLCLFGAESRSLAPYLSRSATGDLMLELTFECGGKVYRARRGYSLKGKASCDLECFDQDYESGPDGGVPDHAQWEPLTLATIKDTDALISQTIGMTRDTYRNSVYLAQGARSIADPNVDPQARRELFFGSLGLDRIWTAAMVTARGELRECEAQLHNLEGRVGTLEGEIEGRADAEQRATSARGVAATAALGVSGIEKQIEALRSQIAEAEKVESRRREYAARLTGAEIAAQRFAEIEKTAGIAAETLTTCEPQIAELEPVAAEKDGAEREIAQAEEKQARLGDQILAAENLIRERNGKLKRIEQRSAEIAGLMARAEAAGNDAGRIGSGEITTCDACGQSIADEAAEKRRETYLAEVEELTNTAGTLEAENLHDQNMLDATTAVTDEQLAELRNSLGGWASEIVARREIIRKAQAAEIELVSLRARADRLHESIDQAKAQGHAEAKQAAEIELQAARDAVAGVGEAVDLDALKRAAESAGYSLNVAQTTARDAHTEVVKAEAELERIAKAEVQLAEHLSLREELNKTHDLLSICEKACGRTGVPLFIVENIAIPAVEEETDRVLQLLGAPYRIEWRTQREKKDGDLAETLDLIVLDDDGEAPYESFSGGEASRIVPAVMLGFARFLNERCGADCRMLLVDELPYLDRSGSGALVDLLRTLVESGQYESVGVVSHDPEVRDAFDQVIEITKDGNRSEVVG
jgi:DNA repair exonuclease SbcCD ATPase subunit/DNA repair exonuclease SbcCD nuclease subunit